MPVMDLQILLAQNWHSQPSRRSTCLESPLLYVPGLSLRRNVLWDGFINFFVFLSEEGVFLLLGQEFEKCFIRWQQDPWTAIVQVAPANDVRASNWTSSM